MFPFLALGALVLFLVTRKSDSVAAALAQTPYIQMKQQEQQQATQAQVEAKAFAIADPQKYSALLTSMNNGDLATLTRIASDLTASGTYPALAQTATNLANQMRASGAYRVPYV